METISAISIIVGFTLALGLLVVGMQFLNRIQRSGESLESLIRMGEKQMEGFKLKASPLEEAIACSLLICGEGCGNVMKWGELSWINTTGNRVTCADVCQRLPIGERGEKFCDLDSAEFPIDIKVEDGELNIDHFKSLFGEFADDVCVVTDKTELKKLTAEFRGNLVYIFIKRSNLAETVETTRCKALVTKDEFEKRGVAVGRVRDGDYYIFVYNHRPPNFFGRPTIGVKFLTACISKTPPTDVMKNDYVSKLMRDCLFSPNTRPSQEILSSCLCFLLNT